MPGEPWDEIMGPSKDELSSMLQEESATHDPPTPAVRTSSTRAAAAQPPSHMFGDRWGSAEPSVHDSTLATQRAVQMASEEAALRESLTALDDDDDDQNFEGGRSSSRIRQEALRMLEVADDRSGYQVHRTTTGGFQASSSGAAQDAPGFKSAKRVPAALSSLVTAATRRYQDNPTERSDYEYGDESVVDVVGMEQRFAAGSGTSTATGAADSTEQSWSSRYSIDRTLLAMSGGIAKNKSSFLDRMDRENKRERTSSRNMFGKSPASTKVFGAGFSFRSSRVFGNQSNSSDADAAASTNLNWWKSSGDNSHEATLGPSTPAKSWQEQLARKQQLRRRIVIAFCAALLLIISVSTASALSKRSKLSSSSSSSSSPSSAAGVHREVTFFMTSTVPLDQEQQHELSNSLEDPNLKADGAFLVHLGNLQLPEVTGCVERAYTDAAFLLRQSPIPTFVLPGSSDWNDCAHPSSALSHWRKSFLFYDTKWFYDWTVERDLGREENFSVLIDGVLFFGLFEVGGKILDWDEFQDRGALNLEWIRSRLNGFGQDEVRAVVVMANSQPGLAQNGKFFKEMAETLDAYGRPHLYVHASHDQDYLDFGYYTYDGVELQVAQSTHGGIEAPLRVTVGFGDEPFVLG